MALVADYSDSSDEELERGEEEEQPRGVQNGLNTSTSAAKESKNDDLISDEEDDVHGGGGSIMDEADADIPGLSSTGANFFSSLPTSVLAAGTSGFAKGFVDEDEDLSTIPKAKEEEAAAAAAAPKPPKRKQKGKVRIVLPSLSDFGDDGDEAADGSAAKKRMRLGGGGGGSKLLSMLPNPKNAVPSKQPSGGAMLVPDSVARKRPAPTGKSPSLMRPTSVSRKAPPTKMAKPAADSDSDEDDHPTAFFTLDKEEVVPIMPELPPTGADQAQPGPSRPRVEATPEVGPAPTTSRGGPSVYGPSKPDSTAEMSVGYADADDLLANNEALERLAGKHAVKTKFEDFDDVVDVNQEHLTADPKDWIAKALSEDAADKPGPKCNVKGQTKKKHQITYLAALAKENEHKLKQQWATAAQNRRAAGAKYGF